MPQGHQKDNSNLALHMRSRIMVQCAMQRMVISGFSLMMLLDHSHESQPGV